MHLPAADEWEFLQAGGKDVRFDETYAFKFENTLFDKSLKVQVFDQNDDEMLGEYTINLGFLEDPDFKETVSCLFKSSLQCLYFILASKELTFFTMYYTEKDYVHDRKQWQAGGPLCSGLLAQGWTGRCYHQMPRSSGHDLQ